MNSNQAANQLVRRYMDERGLSLQWAVTLTSEQLNVTEATVSAMVSWPAPDAADRVNSTTPPRTAEYDTATHFYDWTVGRMVKKYGS